MLGVSNVTVEQLQTLCQKVRVRPRFVQNRCYARFGWDRETLFRHLCEKAGLAPNAWRDPGATLEAFTVETVEDRL